jgi:hypothetical protein
VSAGDDPEADKAVALGRLSDLEIAMAEAAAAQNYEEATRLRNAIQVARQAGLAAAEQGFADEVAGTNEASADFAGLSRQQPGKMGIGSQAPKRTPPEGWTPPKKPDPMTAGHKRGGRRKG